MSNISRIQPSFKQGFARSASDSAYPGLWPDVGAWSPGLGPTGGTLRDISASKNNGTLTSSPLWTVSGGRYALDFVDTSSQYVNTGDSDGLDFGDNDYAMSAWIYSRDIVDATRMMIFGKDVSGGRQLTLELNGGATAATRGAIRIAYFNDGGSVVATGDSPVDSITQDTWHHVFAQRVGDSLQIFIDGVSQTVVEGGSHGVMNSEATALRIGSREYVGSEDYWDGKLDDLFVYSRSYPANVPKLLSDIGRGGIFQRKPRTIGLSVAAAAASVVGTIFRSPVIRV